MSRTLGDAVTAYSARLHSAIGRHHHVASPLGAWLVLALAARATDDPAAEIVDALGMPAAEAGELAVALLAEPPAVLALAAVVWAAERTPELDRWTSGLGPAVETGPIPTQAAADLWAAERTGGLVPRFPISVTELSKLILATAVACATTWQLPLEPADRAELRLPADPAFGGVLLQSLPHVARAAVATAGSGDLAVHAMPSADADMLVVSVIGATETAPAAVLEDALRIAGELGRSGRIPGARSLFDLPLGAGPAWTLTERDDTGTADEEIVDTLLTPWTARSEHELLDLPGSGFRAAGEVLGALLRPDPRGTEFDARQVAMARYTRTGFEAAAVTAIGVLAAGIPPSRPIRVRTAQVEFTRPHAVVAVATSSGSAWAGLPLFSAWVAESGPDESPAE